MALAPATHAECLDWPLKANEQPRVAYAFVATVTDVEQQGMLEWGPGQYRYEFTLSTEQTYRGRVPDQLKLTGINAGCSFVRTEAFAEGQTLFIASEQLRPGTWETWFGDALVWRQVGSAWDFDEEALAYSSDEDYYWPAARTATTTAAILRIVSDAPLPDTASRSEPEARTQTRWADVALMLLVFAATFRVMYWRRGRLN